MPLRREELQNLLARKGLEPSESPVKHLRWFLNAIFKLALSDGLGFNNPAAELPRNQFFPKFENSEIFVHLAGNLRRNASGRDIGPSLESRSEIRPRDGAACLQTFLRHAEEWQNAGGSDLRSDVAMVDGVARSCGGSEPGRVGLPEQDVHHAVIGGQSLAAHDAAEVGEGPPSRMQGQSAELATQKGLDLRSAQV